MKVKEAIKLILPLTGEEAWPPLFELCEEEADSQVQANMRLRHRDRASLMDVSSVADQMTGWTAAVAAGVGLDKDQTKLMTDTQRGNLFAKHRIVDPKADDQMKRMRTAMLRGQHPMEALTQEGLDAMTGMMLGRIRRDVQEWSESEAGKKLMDSTAQGDEYKKEVEEAGG